MKRGGKGTGAGAATAVLLLLALLVLAASQAADGAAAARRLGVAGAGPERNGCSNDPNNGGPPCHGHSPAKQTATGFQPNP
jgi:hypothetical protein